MHGFTFQVGVKSTFLYRNYFSFYLGFLGLPPSGRSHALATILKQSFEQLNAHTTYSG